NVDTDVSDFVRRSVAVHRRMHNRVVQKHYAFLRIAIPAPRVLLIGCIELRIGTKRSQERRLIIGTAAHAPEREALPRGDGLTTADEVFAAVRRAKERMGDAAVTSVGPNGKYVAVRRIVQSVIETGDRAGAIAKGRMLGHILHPFAIDPHLTVVLETVEIFGSGERPRLW